MLATAQKAVCWSAKTRSQSAHASSTSCPSAGQIPHLFSTTRSTSRNSVLNVKHSGPFSAFQKQIPRTFLRCYASDSTSNNESVKAATGSSGRDGTIGLQAQLRRFYKLVHPDMFGAHPSAKAANELGLQRLMSLVERIRKHPGGSAFSAPERHAFVFYVRGSAGGEPREVHGELPLHSGWPALHQALSALFAAAGVPQPSAWQLEAHRAGDELLLDGPQRPASLQAFLRQYAPAAASRRQQHKTERRELLALQRQLEAALNGAVLWRAEGSFLDESAHADRVRVLKALLELAPRLTQRNLLAGVLLRFDAGLGCKLQFRPVPRSQFKAETEDDGPGSQDDDEDELDDETAAGAERAVLSLDPGQPPEQWAAFIEMEVPARLASQPWARASAPPPAPSKPAASTGSGIAAAASVLAAQQRIIQQERQQAARAAAAGKGRGAALPPPTAQPQQPGRSAEVAQAQELALRAQALLGVSWLSFDLSSDAVGARLWEEEAHGRDAEAHHLEYVRESDPAAFARHVSLLRALLAEPQAAGIRAWLKQQAKAARGWRKVPVMLREFTPPKLAHVHEAGVLFLSTRLQPAELLGQLMQHAPEANARAQAARQRLDAFQFLEKRLAAKMVAAERRLWSLHGRDADALIATALARLTRAADSLRAIGLTDQQLVLSDRYALSEHGALLFPHDFEIETAAAAGPVRQLPKPSTA